MYKCFFFKGGIVPVEEMVISAEPPTYTYEVFELDYYGPSVPDVEDICSERYTTILVIYAVISMHVTYAVVYKLLYGEQYASFKRCSIHVIYVVSVLHVIYAVVHVLYM